VEEPFSLLNCVSASHPKRGTLDYLRLKGLNFYLHALKRQKGQSPIPESFVEQGNRLSEQHLNCHRIEALLDKGPPAIMGTMGTMPLGTTRHRAPLSSHTNATLQSIPLHKGKGPPVGCRVADRRGRWTA